MLPHVPARYRRTLPAASVALLAATAALPLAGDRLGNIGVPGVALAIAAVVLLVAISVVPQRLRANSGRSRLSLDLLLHLSPVLLLTAAFPLAVSRITDDQVGGVPLTSLLLASSLTTPWLSMAVCLPLYRGIGHLISRGDAAAIRPAFIRIWPITFLQVIPTVVVFTIPVHLVMGWTGRSLVTYVALCVLHMAFAQSLILANVARDRWRWAFAWTAYAVALLIAPSLWFLPPLAGLVTQLLPLRSVIAGTRGLDRLDLRDVARDVVRGLLLGAVLWSHVLFFFLSTRGDFPVTTVFVALFPAVVAYNYYFVRLAPAFDSGVLAMRASMENDPADVMADRSASLTGVVESSVARTAFLGALLSLVVALAVGVSGLVSASLVSTVALASWAFLMVTLLSYKLDYIGATRQAQLIGGAHLAVCTIAFLVVPAGAGLYGWIFLAELPLLAWALASCLSRWRSPAYVLFWRHATAW